MTQLSRAKKTSLKDWHSADIKAALEKAGWSLRRLATHHGYNSPTQLAAPLNRPWAKGEAMIAEAIGVDPAVIWPSRYSGKHNTRVRQEHRASVLSRLKSASAA